MNICVFFSSVSPQVRFNAKCSSFASPFSSVNPFTRFSVPTCPSIGADAGGITKYSSSSLRTIIACFVRRGFREPVKSLGVGFPGSTKCAWA